MRHTGDSYDRLAWLYDAVAQLYSGGQIQELKSSQIGELRPGEKVLYAGVGGGEDAVLAAQHQVRLTVLDLSPLMLEQALCKFRAAGCEESVELICSDVLEHNRPAYYDTVVANFFLNVFSEPAMQVVLGHLASLLKPGGKLVIGDFSYPRGRLPTRIIQRLYYNMSMFSFWLAGGTTLHPIYDYPGYFEVADLRMLASKSFKVSNLFPASFETITAVKA